MSKSGQKEIMLQVDLGPVGFPKTLFFNRFRIDRDEGFRLVQFGLVVASDLIDSYSCILSDLTLEQNKAAALGYVNKLSSTGEDVMPWKGVTSGRNADLVDILAMSFRGDVSETALYMFSMCSVSRISPGETSSVTVPSQPMALLRSSTTLQKQFIEGLYNEI